MKKYIVFISIFAIGIVANLAFAMPDLVPAINNNSGRSLVIPARAVEVAPNVFSLGTVVDQESGELVEGYAIVHYKNEKAKPDKPGGGKGNKGTSSCYGFLAKDAKWKNVESWVVNTSNTRGLDGTTVFNILDNGITKWESAANFDILGSGSITTDTLIADTVSTDGLNEIYFADVSSSGAIGVTIVWGVFGGPPQGRKLVEWDQIYDDTDFDWSTTGDPLKMDFDNIATHELGHSVGMGDLYESGCNEETMYGYATEGETQKRDLNAGDIEGINKLY